MFSRSKIPNIWTRIKSIKIKLFKLIGVDWKDPAFNYHNIPKNIISTAKKAGFNGDGNLVEFWFNNRDAIIDGVLKGRRDVSIIQFEETHKWLTPIGKQCLDSLRIYISQNYNRFPPITIENKKYRQLDLEGFSFLYEEKEYNLNTFHRYINLLCHINDLRVNLKGIKYHHLNLDDFYLGNVDLSYSLLYDCKFSNTYFDNVSFSFASVKCCQFSNVIINEKCNFMATDLYGCQFGHMEINDTLAEPTVKIKKISYVYLLVCLFDAFRGKFNNDIVIRNVFRYMKHNSFFRCTTKNIIRPETNWLKEYVNWYQYVMLQLGTGFHHKTIWEKLVFSLSIITTKCWTSYKSLAFVALSISSLFAYIYYHLPPCSLNHYDASFLSAFYYSVVTFTTLGYGDITPATELAKVIVMIEVVLGYITLGSFVFLIGHKVSARY